MSQKTSPMSIFCTNGFPEGTPGEEDVLAEVRPQHPARPAAQQLSMQ